MPPKKTSKVGATKPAKPKAKATAKSKWTDAHKNDQDSKKKYLMGLADLFGIDDDVNDPYDDERHDPAGFTKDYLQRTSLHGLQ